LHAACEFASCAEDNTGHGRWDHRPLLDNARAAVVSCATATLGTTHAAWASLTGTATLDGTVVLVTTVNCGATEKFHHAEKDQRCAARRGAGTDEALE
jgi:hypothetical protein